MLRLIPLAGPDKGRPVEVADGALLGRGSECALSLPHASVSRVHARVERRGAAWWLVDQGSRNGILLADQRQSELELIHGQRIQLGEFPLRVELLASDPAPAGTASEAPAAAEEFEFAEQLEGLELLQTRAVPRASSAPSPEPGLELEDPAQIELAAPVRPAPAPGPAALARERQAEFLRREQRERSGLWRGDFEQLSFGQQALLFAVALLVLLGIAALVATLVGGARAA
jgi:predicted component of type VI protein secretion system